ncbi:hypothetical protein [Chryseobacterium sp.]|uniref:hypothetical protein n=1 Tax=Chryseobacterium sp. TaxID=1871047 RepID=UPI0011CA5791|nr:hypothetical protein [Chryseobacterium sp.]TXF77780.1 hypothetical protein FUA25_07610 [Chryseobacterium sp.]
MIYTADFFAPSSMYPADDFVQLVDSFTNENVNYIKSDSTAWIDDGVVFRTKDSIFYILSNYFSGEYVNVKQFGAKGNGTENDAPIINHAIETTARLKMRLFIPKTEAFYLIDPELLEGDESTLMQPTVHVGMLIQSNMHLFSDGAVLRLKDNVSTASENVAIRMFFSNQFLNDISISGLVLDMNGLNNLITNPAAVPFRYSRETQFHFGFSGTPDGVAAGANNVLIENCSFINTAGVTCIGMGQSNTEDVVLGTNWVIRNNLFKNNGLDSIDHSSIYALANGVNCYNNTFFNDTMKDLDDPTGGQVAYEVHGSNQNFFSNNIVNYFQGLWVANNVAQPKIEHIYIYDNTFRVSGLFVDFYNFNLEQPPFYPIEIENVVIRSNVGTITNDTVPDFTKQFVRLNSKKAASNVFIENNTLISESQDKECSFASAVHNEGQVSGLHHIFINNNSGTNLDNGCLFFWGSDIDYGHIEVLNNSFTYKNSSAFDIKLYGEPEMGGKILSLVVSNISSIFSDNNERAVISGDFTYPYTNMDPGGVSVGNGHLKSSLSSSRNFLTVNVELTIGSSTTFDGYPITFKINETSSETSTVCDAIIVKSTDRFLVKGIVDRTGSWCTLVDANGIPINSGVPTPLTDGTVISCIFVVDNNEILI